jgi:hypothetical protein
MEIQEKLGNLGKLWIVIECAPHSYDIWAHLPLTEGYVSVESGFQFIGRRCLYQGPACDLQTCYDQCKEFLSTQRKYSIRQFFIVQGKYPKELKKLQELFNICNQKYSS